MLMIGSGLLPVVLPRRLRHVDDWKRVTAGGAAASPELTLRIFHLRRFKLNLQEMFWHMFVLLAWGLFFLATILVWSMARLNILQRILGLLKMLCYKRVTAGGAATSPELTLRIFHLRRFKLNLQEMFWHMFVLLAWGLFFLATILVWSMERLNILQRILGLLKMLCYKCNSSTCSHNDYWLITCWNWYLGLFCSCAPLHIRAEIRGALGSVNQLFSCIGILAAFVAGLPLAGNPAWFGVHADLIL